MRLTKALRCGRQSAEVGRQSADVAEWEVTRADGTDPGWLDAILRTLRAQS